MIHQTLMAIGSLTSVALPPQGTGGLTELSASFHTRIPIVTVYAKQNGSSKAFRFALDSGAMQSMHLRMKSEGSRTLFADPSCKVKVSKVTFLPLAEASVAQSLRLEFQKMSLDGVLGFDFFSEHDVVINYQNSRVWIAKTMLGPAWIAKNAQWFTKLKLFDYDGSKVVWSRNPKDDRNSTLLVFDTGASITCLPEGTFEYDKESDLGPYHRYTIDGTLVGRRVIRELTIDGCPTILRAKVFVGPGNPMLCPADFGSKLLVQFRQNTVWKLKPESSSSTLEKQKLSKLKK